MHELRFTFWCVVYVCFPAGYLFSMQCVKCVLLCWGCLVKHRRQSSLVPMWWPGAPDQEVVESPEPKPMHALFLFCFADVKWHIMHESWNFGWCQIASQSSVPQCVLHVPLAYNFCSIVKLWFSISAYAIYQFAQNGWVLHLSQM